jgi:hypothetical protein
MDRNPKDEVQLQRRSLRPIFRPSLRKAMKYA